MKPSKQELDLLMQDDFHCPIYPEEKLVDYVMERLTYAESMNVEQHLKICDVCSGIVTEWSELLGTDTVTAFGESTKTHLTSDEHQPSTRVRSRLMRSAYMRSLRSRFRIKKQVVLQALSGTLLILLIAGLLTLKGNDGQSNAAFEYTVNQRIAEMQSKATEQYVIQPVEPFYGSGSVWLKRDSGEMLIVVNGLHFLEEKDYQVWLQDDDHLSSAGFMLVQGLQGKSYYYGYGAEKAKRIVVSMEPKGGSRRPTGLEAVLVNIGP